MLREEQWFIKREGQDKQKIEELCKANGIDRMTATILLNRDVKTSEDVNKFLNSNLQNLIDPYLMKDMDKAILRTKEAIQKQEKITIYGDYDCDGVCSTTILYKALKRCGANFDYHIPDRESEGYGMNSIRVEKLAKAGTKVILTCDNGIAAFEEIDLANDFGMDVILTDHHDVQYVDGENGKKVLKTPNAYAIINPKQVDCNYPFGLLCGAGIAFKFTLALYRELGIPDDDLYDLLEICAIATVCDVVDLKWENRIIVKEGLKRLNNSKNKGINALKQACDIDKKKIEAYHLGFVIGPCINATGRLEVASISVELLIAEDTAKAKKLAFELVTLNERRKDLTAQSVEEVVKQIEDEELYEDKVIMVYNPNIHESIAGIVAGRVKEKYNLPTIVMTKGSEMPKGSARSIDEYNMFEELSKCKHLMEKFGGHPMAAGLSAREENLPKIRALLNENCTLTENDMTPKVRIDLPLAIGQVDFSTIDDISKLEPFGKGNVTPIIADKRVLVTYMKVIGNEHNHIRFDCVDMRNKKCVTGLYFNKADEFREVYDEKFGFGRFDRDCGVRNIGFYIDIIYKPSINDYNGNISIQVIINNLRLSR